MAFIHDDFLLTTKAARRIFHEFAENEPILDYHSHLPPQDIAENRQFETLYDIWLAGDHYKWRAMRANGTPENLVTGDGSKFDKFKAFAETIPHTLRNPLYHWTHLELKRHFGIDDLLDGDSAESIWERANEQLATAELSTHGIIKKFDVRAIGTTDDPTDELAHHQAISESDLECKVVPTFRPDNAIKVSHPEVFNPWVDSLAEAANMEIYHYSDLLEALRVRHDYFHSLGCRLSDHSIDRAYAEICPESEADAIFNSVRHGSPADRIQTARFTSNIMHFIGLLNAEKEWTMQLHIGALRNNNTRLLKAVGADAGVDSIDDHQQARPLSKFLDLLDRENSLPRTILYNLNPANNYVFAAMAGNFQDGSIPGKVQFGSGWWFLDQKEGMEWQLNTLSNLGLLSRFIGMLTDSRSFMSNPRHEYFRRTLCNLVGRDIENGEIPDDDSLVGPLIKNICYRNAEEFLRL